MSQISTYMRMEINEWRQNLGLKLVNLVRNIFSPLAALLSSALELQNIEFSK